MQPYKVKREHELKVPVKSVQQTAFTCHYLLKRGNQRRVSLAHLLQLNLDVAT
jgi:hypothetical protein